MTKEDDYITAYQREAANRRQAIAASKALVFDALAAAGITEVTVEFDGEGDSGGIEYVTAMRSGARAALPDCGAPLPAASPGADGPEPRTLREALESLCYDCLAGEHDGWENNDGAYGTFTFDVAARTIALEFSERFSDVTTTSHEF